MSTNRPAFKIRITMFRLKPEVGYSSRQLHMIDYEGLVAPKFRG